MRPDRPAGAAVVTLSAVLAAAVVAGCAAIPTDGQVQSGRDVAAHGKVGDPYVRVFAEPPRGGENVYQIVEGFLEASGTVESDYATARAYLAPTPGRSWRPRFRITVYDHNHVAISQPQEDIVEFVAPEVGRVDDQGGFIPAEPGRQVQAVFRLARFSGQWRIVDVPPGLYVSQQDFAREYRALDLYYFDPSKRVLVPDPVFLPVRAGLATALTEALLRGPSRWLGEAVTSDIPVGTALDGDSVPVDGGIAQVRLNDRALTADPPARQRLVAQLTSTLAQVPEVSAVNVSVRGAPLSTTDGKAVHEIADVARFAPADTNVEQNGYYLRDRRLYFVDALPVPGPLGNGSRPISAPAASPDGSLIAAISADRRTVWTAARNEPDALRPRARGGALHSPSYDQFGNLWIVDGDGADPSVSWVPDKGGAMPVVIPGLAGASITVLRVADDGIRVALVTRRAGRSEVLVGVVQRNSGRLVVSGLRRVGQRLLNARDVAWARGDQLVVLAAEARAQLQPYYVSLDGSQIQPGQPLAGIVSIAAAPGQPLLAATADRSVWRLRSGGPWVQLARGEYPVYPG